MIELFDKEIERLNEEKAKAEETLKYMECLFSYNLTFNVDKLGILGRYKFNTSHSLHLDDCVDKMPFWIQNDLDRYINRYIKDRKALIRFLTDFAEDITNTKNYIEKLKSKIQYTTRIRNLINDISNPASLLELITSSHDNQNVFNILSTILTIDN